MLCAAMFSSHCYLVGDIITLCCRIPRMTKIKNRLLYKKCVVVDALSVNSYFHKMMTLRLYREEIGLLSRNEVINASRDVFKSNNGEAFFATRRWPQDIQLIFWKKPISDQGTFKLVRFLLGNGCAPDLISRWVMLSQFWASSPSVVEKRAQQVDFIVNNADTKRNSWFYYDVDYEKLLLLNGKPKAVKCMH